MSILDKKTSGDARQADDLHRRHHAGDRRAGGPDRQPQLPVRPATTRRSSPTPPAWSRATTSGSPASRSAASRTSRSSTARTRWSPSTSPSDSIVTKSSTATIRYRNLVGQRYISLTQGVGDLDRLPEDAHDPDGPHRAGARPDRPVQRLQAAVRRRSRRPTSTSSPPRSIQVFQGEGGNFNGLLQQHRVADQHAGRPRPGDRRPDRQPQRRAGHARRPRQAAQRADHRVQGRSWAGWSRTRTRSWARWTRSPAWPTRPPTSPSASARRSCEDVKGLRQVATQPEQGPRRDRPGAADPADQAHQDRPHRDLRLVLQLLPVPRSRATSCSPAGRPGRRRLPARRPTTSGRCDLG